MEIVEIIRLETDHVFGTLGYMKIRKKMFCVTLEPPDELNKPFLSSIPPGQYVCERHVSPKFGETFIILGVPDRDNVLFHKGNTVEDTEGCIVVGQHVDKLRTFERAILNSGVTFARFMKKMEGRNRFHLTITENY